MSEAGEKKVDAKAKRFNWPSGLQLAFSSLVILGAWAIAVGSLVLASADIASGRMDIASQAGRFFSAGSFFFVGLVLFPSAWLAALNLRGKTVKFNARFHKIARWLRKFSPLLFFGVLAVGTYVSQIENVRWFAIPIIHLVGVAIVASGLIWLATRELNSGSEQRTWGALGSGLSLSPLLAFGAELLVGVVFFFAAVFYIGANPELLQGLESLRDSPALLRGDVEALLPLLGPLLADPFLLILIVGYVGLAVPLIEELLKPMAVYLLLRRDLKPKDGFVLGALSGAGFAILEYLTLGATFEGWAAIFVARIGTTAVHIFTSGLVGWAIVTAKNEKRYWLLLGSYGLSVAIHSLWNSMAVLGSFTALGQASGSSLLPSHLIISSGLVLFILAGGSILLLWKSNARLRSIEAEATIRSKEKLKKDK